MARTGRPGLSAEQKRELWVRWKDGQSLSDIGRALGKHAGSVFGVLQAKGGIAPPLRKRSGRALTLEEREEISRGLVAALSLRQIAAQLGRSPSTISREIGHNGGRIKYRAMAADSRSWQQACRPKSCLLATNRSLQAVVAEKLAQHWSPQEVSGWLEAEYPYNEAMRVSHETIYRSLFIQARGVLKRELLATLRSRRLMRRAKTSTTEGQPRGQIIDAVSVRDRPAEIEDRAVPGHWEGDLLSGTKNTHVATLVERQSRFLMLVQVDGKDTGSVVDALVRQVQQLPQGLMLSLTWDRGMELAQHGPSSSFGIGPEPIRSFSLLASPTRASPVMPPRPPCHAGFARLGQSTPRQSPAAKWLQLGARRRCRAALQLPASLRRASKHSMPVLRLFYHRPAAVDSLALRRASLPR